MGSQGLPRSDVCPLLSSQAELPFRAGDVITVFGNMDDDGFYYVRSSWGERSCTVLPFSGSLRLGRHRSKPFSQKAGGRSPITSFSADTGLRVLARVSGSRDRTGNFSVSSASPPQGELNGQRGLVPSNFLEGPGPEAGGLDSGTSQAESQVSEELSCQISISSLPCWCAGSGIVWWRFSEARVHDTEKH